ncbi:MAG: TonB-dependent receptor [Bacteroidetes bacterium]|nr:TonB-dependent receptor [Bacteroidota bacterium]
MRLSTLLLFLLLSLPASAAVRSSLYGQITDTAGQPLPGAIIELPELHTGDVADTGGHFHINDLPSGRFLVSVRLLGFASQSRYVQLQGQTQLNLRLIETVIAQHEVVVTGTSLATGLRRSVAPVQSISATQMREQASSNIIDAISRMPGVRQVSTGPAISKPVIRGLGYNRVVTVSDGIRQEGQQWGDEHGIEIDDYNLSRVEVVKGPSSLTYGSDAVAGVINILSPLPPPDGHIQAQLATNYQSNNGQFALHGRVVGNEQGLNWSAYYTGKRAHDYQNSADGFVFDSRFRNDDFGASIGIRKHWGNSKLSFTSFNQTLGIPEGTRDSLSGRFLKPINLGGLEEEIPVTEADGKSYDRNIPSQHIRHQRLAWNSEVFLHNNDRLSFTAGYQQNDRKEFGDVLQPDIPGLWLRLRSITGNLQYQHQFAHDLQFITGLNSMSQQNENRGSEFIVPDYQLFDLGGFAMLRRETNHWTFAAGLRLDHRDINGAALYEDSTGQRSEKQTAGGFIRFTSFSRSFLAPSGSLGLSFAGIRNTVLRFNLASGFRTPNIAELAANGVHEGALRYEYGNTNLKPEHSIQADLGGNWHSDHLSFQADLFANYISNYIFYQKLLGQNGADSIPSLENPEGYSAFSFTQTQALLSGGELYFDLHPHPFDWLHLEQSISYVQGQNLEGSDSTQWLPQMPAARWLSGIRVQRAAMGKHITHAWLKLEADHYFAQSQVFRAYGSETASPEYTLLNASLGFDWQQKGKTVCTLIVSAQNLADIAYQNHLSRLRYADVNPVNGRMGISGMGRNLSLTLQVPMEWK